MFKSTREKIYQALGSAYGFNLSDKNGIYNAIGKKKDINLKILGRELLTLHFIADEKKEIADMLISVLALSHKEIRILEQYFNGNEFDEQSFKEVRETINNAKNDMDALNILLKKINKSLPKLGNAINKRIRITEKGIISIRELFTV